MSENDTSLAARAACLMRQVEETREENILEGSIEELLGGLM